MTSDAIATMWLALGGATLVALVLLAWCLRQRRALEVQSREIRRLHRHLHDQRVQAAEADRERKQVISIVSHDLKGPFNRIFALAQLMAMGEPLSPQQAAYLQHIHRLVADGLGMVRNLVDTRNLEGDLVAQPERLSVNDAVRSLLLQFQPLAEKKKINLQWQQQPDCFVLADRAMLGRVLDNVLSNAIKFSSGQKEILIATKSEDSWVQLAVCDQGPGFTPEDQARMYKRFQKLSARPTGGETSTGLGLWIVKLLMERMGGRVGLETEPGVGSKFMLYLPADQLKR